MHPLRQCIESVARQSPELIFIPRASRPKTYGEIAAEFEKHRPEERKVREADDCFRRLCGETASSWLIRDTAMGIAFDITRCRKYDEDDCNRLEAAYTDWVRIALHQAWIVAFKSHHMSHQAIKRADASIAQGIERNIQNLVRTVGVLLTDFDESLVASSQAYMRDPYDTQSHRAALSALLCTNRQLRDHTNWEFFHRHSSCTRQNGHRSPIRSAHATHTVCLHGRSSALASRSSMQMTHGDSPSPTMLNRRPETVATSSILVPFGMLMRNRSTSGFLDTVDEDEDGNAAARLLREKIQRPVTKQQNATMTKNIKDEKTNATAS